MKNKTFLELIRYIVIGGITTGVNFLIYGVLIHLFEVHWSIANVIAWVGAVLFAYWSNKSIVFQSHEGNTQKEMVSFFVLRFASLIVESILLFICIQIVNLNPLISKGFVSVVTIVLNYVFCKGFIFKEKIHQEGGTLYG